MTNPLPFMGLLWTISVEEQFYLFWPWVVRYVPRKRIVVIPILMIAVACIVRATLTFNLLRLVWSFTFSRLDPIAVGILIALLPALNPRPALRLMLVMIGIASWGFAAGWCGLPYQNDTLLISMGFPARRSSNAAAAGAVCRSADPRCSFPRPTARTSTGRIPTLSGWQTRLPLPFESHCWIDRCDRVHRNGTARLRDPSCIGSTPRRRVAAPRTESCGSDAGSTIDLPLLVRSASPPRCGRK